MANRSLQQTNKAINALVDLTGTNATMHLIKHKPDSIHMPARDLDDVMGPRRSDELGSIDPGLRCKEGERAPEGWSKVQEQPWARAACSHPPTSYTGSLRDH